jgi:hypothetical protein
MKNLNGQYQGQNFWDEELDDGCFEYSESGSQKQIGPDQLPLFRNVARNLVLQQQV